MKIKIFYGYDENTVENDTNVFLNSGIKVIDIKSSTAGFYSENSNRGKISIHIMVIYEDGPEIKHHKDGEEE